MRRVVLSVLGVVALLGVEITEASHGSAGSIDGKSISLFENHHALAGSIFNVPTFAVFKEKGFSARVEFRLEDQTLQMLIRNNQNRYSGKIEEMNPADHSVRKTTSVLFDSIEEMQKGDAVIHLIINEEPVDVNVRSSEFVSNHFINPIFTASFQGQKIEFKMKGQACFGYAVNLAMMVITPYVHLSGEQKN